MVYYITYKNALLIKLLVAIIHCLVHAFYIAHSHLAISDIVVFLLPTVCTVCGTR